MGKFMIVDGNSLIHRAFHALPLLQSSSGEYTNAVYGFINMFQRAIRELAPTHGAVAFDVSKHTFRTKIYDKYKATRKETPTELRGQFQHVKIIAKALGFAVIEKETYEADDIIGTLSKKAEAQGHDVIIVTGDRDAYQLISPRIKVLLTRKGISETELTDETLLREKYCLNPNQMIDLKALMGDSSDNIPGVPGVGEKTALKLLTEYETLDNLYLNVQAISGKLGERLREFKDLAYISKELAAIDINVVLDIDVKDCLISASDIKTLTNIYEHLGFKQLLKGLPKEIDNELLENSEEHTCHIIKDTQELSTLLKEERLVLYITYKPPVLEALPLNMYFSSGKDVYILEYGFSSEIQNVLKNYLASNTQKIFYDLKAAIFVLNNAGYIISGNNDDISLMAYLLNYNIGTLDDAVQAVNSFALSYPVLLEKLKSNGLLELYHEIELPLVPVLADMELTGICIDKNELSNLDADITLNIDKLKSEIFALAEEEFNLNSPKQLGVILFEKLNLPIIKKTKNGYSTDADVLEELTELHEIIAKILEYRTLAKLKSTYVLGLQNAANIRTGRLHTSFNQAITATGRLSSTEPNLQNIPVRMEVGRRIRKAFKAMPGTILIAADYSQIELRILAHLSHDENFVDAFIKGQDIHSRTAQEVFDVSEEELTKEMRRRAKAVNFGIVYGISDYGLSKDLRISRKEAKTYIDNYFNRYVGVKKYLDDVVLKARTDGYVTTLLNRRRFIPEISSSNRNIRNFAERTAMNTPIQGTAADIIKIAMIKIFNVFNEKKLLSKMLLQVHDELIFQVPLNEVETVITIIKDQMENAFPLIVPVVVDLKTGPDWYNMKPYYGGL